MNSDVSVVVSVAVADQNTQRESGTTIGSASTMEMDHHQHDPDEGGHQLGLQLEHQDHQHFPLLDDDNQLQVETALSDLVSGVVAQTAPHQEELQQQHQVITTHSTTPHTAGPSSSANPTATDALPSATDNNVPWAWQFALASVATSVDGDGDQSTTTSTHQDPNIGFVHTLDDAYDVMRTYEVHTTSKFVQVRTVQDFGKDLDCLKYKHRVRFEERKDDNVIQSNRLPLKDKPFLLLGSKWFECEHGRDYHIKFKRRRNEAIENGDILVTRRNKTNPSKKVGCPAKIWMKDVLVFPTKQMRNDLKTGRKMLSKEIRAGMVKGERRIYVFLPHASHHSYHPIGEESGNKQRVDRQVIDHIYWLVSQAITTTTEVQFEVEKFVKEELFKYRTPPSTTNRRFYPTRKDIRNHIVAARKGRLPPKDRAELAKLSSSSATMCASNKLAFPTITDTAKCKSLAKQFVTLTKRIKNPSVLAGATKKMEDLVAYLRAGAQKDLKVQRMANNKPPSMLQSTTLERPLKRKRPRVKRDNDSKGTASQEKLVKHDGGSGAEFCTVPGGEVYDNVITSQDHETTGVEGQGQFHPQQNQETCRQDFLNQVEMQSLGEGKQSHQVHHKPSQMETTDQLDHQSQHERGQSQQVTTQELVKISLQPLQGAGSIGTFPMDMLQNPVILQNIFQGSNHQITVLPQSQFQAVQVNRTNDPDKDKESDDSSSAARALIQLDTIRTADLQQQQQLDTIRAAGLQQQGASTFLYNA